jgi:hypothetical protein
LPPTPNLEPQTLFLPKEKRHETRTGDHDAKHSEKLDKLGRAARRAHDRVRACAAKAVENMVRAGQALCKARDLCDTEEWDEFVAKYLNKAERTAQTYMRLARSWPVLQAVAPPEALTSQRKALRLLNSLALGEPPAGSSAGQRQEAKESHRARCPFHNQ